MAVASDAIAQYKQEGYAVFQEVVPPDELAEMASYIDRYVAGYEGRKRPEHLDKPHVEDPKFLDFCANRHLLDLVEPIIGPNVVLFSSHVICKAKSDGYAVPWHQDGIYWPLEPMNVVTCWLAIDEATVENGCMRVIPGTHKLGPVEHVDDEHPETKVLHRGIPESSFDASQAVDIELKPGGCSLHAPYLIHGSAPNTSDKRRCGFTIRYMPAETKMIRTGPLSKWFGEHPLYLLRGRDETGVNEYANG